MDDKLVDWLASVSDDPLAFVLGAFPWKEPNSRLEKEDGPEEWQRDILLLLRDYVQLEVTTRNEAIQMACQLAVASGHGVGKSALVAWIILWGISTMTDAVGVVTANTEAQLKTKTWKELGKWHRMFLAKDHFKLTATEIGR